jgi:5-oxoprolinase (ATP-hydrolysing)
VISPVFHPESKEIIFFTASRGHHADIGGILPGSMPPTSVNLFEEGAEIVSFKLVKEGVFDNKGLYEYMVDKPAKYPGSSGCRNIRDVESDLKAVSQIYHTHPWILEKMYRALANCCQPQRNSIAPPKYAFSLLSQGLGD